MKVCGRAIATFTPLIVPSAMPDSAALIATSARARFPSRFATAKPTLWRVFAKPSPGFPSPTMSLSTRGPFPPPKNLRTFLPDEPDTEIGPRAEMARVLGDRVFCCPQDSGATITAMRFPEFAMERMQSTWEHRVKYDLSESGLEALTLDDAVRDLGVLGKERLGYANGMGRDETRAPRAALPPP